MGAWAAACDPVTPGIRAHQAAGFQGEGRQGQVERPPKEPRSSLRRGPPRGGCLCGAGLEVPAEPALLPADRLLSLTLLAFEGLNTAASKDRCLACIEEPFFSPLWPLLLAIYRWGPAPEVHLGATLRGRLPFPASGVWGSKAVPRPPSRILGVAGSLSRVSVRPGAGVFGPLNLASLHPRNVHRLREAALSRSMELYRNAPPAAIGVPTRLLPQDPEAAGAGPYPYCAAAQELGLLVLESCPQKKLECIGEGAVWEGRAVSLPTGHPESAPLNHSLVPSGGEESLGTKEVLVLPCPVLHGVGVRRCPGPVWDAVPTPSPEAWLLRLSSGLAGHLRLCGGLLPGPGGCLAAWHRRYVSPRRVRL